MKQCDLWGGTLYYGSEKIEAPVVEGKRVSHPKWLIGVGRGQVGVFRYRRLRSGEKRFWVVNFTHPAFALGATTSGGAGIIAVWSQIVKRGGSRAGDTHRPFRGILAQLGFHWFKVYAYIFPNKDGFR